MRDYTPEEARALDQLRLADEHRGFLHRRRRYQLMTTDWELGDAFVVIDDDHHGRLQVRNYHTGALAEAMLIYEYPEEGPDELMSRCVEELLG